MQTAAPIRARLVAVTLPFLIALIAVPAARANPVADVWDWGTGVVSGAVSGVASDGIRALTSWVADGAGWLVERAFAGITATSTPQLAGGWFSATYARMSVIGALVAAPCLMLGLIQSLIRQDPRLALRVVAAVPASVLLSGAAVAVTQLLLEATDAASAWLIAAGGHDAGAFAAQMALALSSAPQVSAFVVFLAAAVTAVVALLVWVELLIRAALVYVLVGFVPVMSVVWIWPAASHGLLRLARLIVSVVVSKLVICAVIAIGITAASQGTGTTDRFQGVLVGVAMLAVAAASPVAVHRLLPLFEEAVSVRGNLTLGGGARTAQNLSYAAGGAGAGAASNLRAQLAYARSASPPHANARAATTPPRPTPPAAAGPGERREPNQPQPPRTPR